MCTDVVGWLQLILEIGEIQELMFVVETTIIFVILFHNIGDCNEFIGANNYSVNMKTPKVTIINHENENQYNE